MKLKKPYLIVIALLVSLTIVLSGCSNKSNSSTSSSSSTAVTSTSNDAVSVKYDTEDYYFNWKGQNPKTIDVSSGSQTITSSGIYEITGTLKDGSLIVNVDKSVDAGIVYLVLNNTNISSSTSAPILIQDAKKVVLILENGTTNTVYQGSSVKVNASGDPSSAILSTADLTITGSGTLNVTSDYSDGITCKDKFKMTDGTLVIKAKQDGIVGKDLLAVEKANITITAGKDGMRSTNETDAGMGNIVIKNGTYNITASNDGLQAFTFLQIDGGIFNITTGGGYSGSTKTNGNKGDHNNETTQSTNTEESKKGLKATQSILINGGTFTLSCTDDTIHSNGNITITGGNLTMQSGDDGIHSDTNIKITAGDIIIKNANEGIEAKDITIEDGKISMTTSDDGFNVNNPSGILTINGGEVYINAGGDGVDSNGTIMMTGGSVNVDGPTDNGNGAIDYDQTFTISGGTIIASGSSGMAQVPEAGTQPSILMYFTSTQSAGTQITLKDNSDNTVATFTPAKTFASIGISSSNLKSGTSYTLYKGSTKVVTFTLSDTTTYVNESGVTTKQSMGGGPGGPDDKGRPQKR